MSMNYSRCTKSLLVAATLLFASHDTLQAQETELVELTFMLVTHPLAADTIADPSGDDAIGFVLDGNRNETDDGVGTEYGEFGSFGDSSWNPTDASYITKGGTSSVSVYVRDVVLPAHGFINLRRSLIEESLEAFATFNSGANEFEFESVPASATHFVLFISGLFEVSWR